MSGSKGKENSGTFWQFLRLLQLCTYLVCTLYRRTALCKCQVHWHDFDCEASNLGIQIWTICLKITRFKGFFFEVEEWGHDKNLAHFYKIKWFKNYQKFVLVTQCPRTGLNKRFLPKPKTTIAWKLIPHRSKISNNWNPPHWVPLHRFFKNWFLLIQKQLYSNYIQTHFTL